MKKKNIMIVDDEPKILRFIEANLKSLGYETTGCKSGKEALEKFDLVMPDLVLLDVMMPHVDGFQFLKTIRNFSKVPIIMLTAKDNIRDKVEGLNLGADDYLTKPFSLEELFARVNALLRRTEQEIEHSGIKESACGPVRINYMQRRVWILENEVYFTDTEYKLLSVLVQNAGKVMTHEFLLSKVWGSEFQNDVQYLRVNIGRIRQKIRDASLGQDVIKTYSGVGYMFVEGTQ